MTISTETCAIQYTGNSVQTVFTFPFLIPSSLVGPQFLIAITDSTGATAFAPPSNYSVSGLGNPNGGSVVFPLSGSPIDSQTKLTIIRNVLYEQFSAINNQGFLPHSVEQIADYLTLQTQQLNERAGRALSAPPGETMGFLPAKLQRAGLFLSFDANGNPVMLAGTGGGGGTAWVSITAKPPTITAIEGLTPGAGQIIEYTSSGSAHMIPTPSGGGGTGVTSVNTRVGDVLLTVADVLPGFGNQVAASLQAGTNVTLSTSGGVTTIAASGGGGSGNMQPRLLSDYHAIDGGGVNTASNDLAFAAAEAAGDSAVYIPDGIYATTRAENTFSKHYVGRGVILFPGAANDALPPTYSYMLTKPTTWPTQGRTGWFRGDQRFTDGGEYKVIGAGVREFDITQRYFESNTIPHHAWMDINSGNSGVQAYATSGAGIGATSITLNGVPDASWVGKTFATAQYADAVALDTRVVTAIVGNAIQFTPGLSVALVWNPAAGLTPCVYFGHRTSASPHYDKITTAGGGDSYGYIVRNNANYAPKATEYHPFMAQTVSQFGGDVYANHDGVYIQSWESQLQGQTYDITGIGFVQSYVRNKDESFYNKTWMHNFAQSTGTRPVDVYSGVLGNWRYGVDTCFASLYETTVVRTNYTAGDATIALGTINGAHNGDTIVVGSETRTINGITPGAGIQGTITLSTPLTGSYAAGVLVTFPSGGAIINSKLGQRWMMNSQVSALYRGSDPLGVYPSSYGNQQGDMIIESATDGFTDKILLRIARGPSSTLPDIARIRLVGDHAGNGIVQIYGTGTHTISGTGLGLTAGCSLNMIATNKFSFGSGTFLWENGAGNIELVKHGVVVQTW